MSLIACKRSQPVFYEIIENWKDQKLFKGFLIYLHVKYYHIFPILIWSYSRRLTYQTLEQQHVLTKIAIPKQYFADSVNSFRMRADWQL